MLYRQSLVMDAVSQRHKVRGLYKPLSKPYRDCSQRVTWTLHACVYVSITSPRSDFEGARGSSSGLSWVKHVLDSSSSRGQGMSWAVVSHTCTCLSLQQGLLLMTTENRFLVYGAHLALQSSPEVLGFWAIWHCPHCYIHQWCPFHTLWYHVPFGCKLNTWGVHGYFMYVLSNQPLVEGHLSYDVYNVI